MTKTKVEVIQRFTRTVDPCDVNSEPQTTCPRAGRLGHGYRHDREPRTVEFLGFKFGAMTGKVLASEFQRVKRQLEAGGRKVPHTPGIARMPDFSVEARYRWTMHRADARFAAQRREEWAEATEPDPTLPVPYPWGKP